MKMKKRLLALALCLVMAVSLLPITAAAAGYHFNSARIVADGVEYRDTSSEEYEGYYVNVAGWTLEHNAGTIVSTDEGFITVSPIYSTDMASQYLLTPPVEGVEYFPFIFIHNSSLLPNNFEYDDAFSAVLVVPGYETKFIRIFRDNQWAVGLQFSMIKHSWQFTQTDSTLTAKCQNEGCGTPPLSLTLKADSVTLPDSPFNARLEGLEQFKKEIPNAVIGDFVYKYKGPGDSEYRVVAPTAANAKAGEYQVGVRISGLPNKEYGPVAMSLDDEVIPDGAGYADLYVKYTAVDPKVTAQTGDNRPIELMMMGVVLFSALAAAAFILDNKRKYSR